MSDVLPLELVDTPAVGTCWYCGSTTGPWEREHQLPVSRGGESGDNVVLGLCGLQSPQGQTDRRRVPYGARTAPRGQSDRLSSARPGPTFRLHR